jgi:Reverse transcriptase (RNA-dependent DNA polymerase)
VAPEINSKLTVEEFKYEWTRCREFTSSGKSTLHFGHFKASCSHNDTMELDRMFSEISLSTGYSLKRWQTGINVMIPKKEDSVRVDKLRTIVLLEADFNFLNKIIGKRMMRQGESTGAIAEEQFGSRKQKSAILHALNKQLTIDIARHQKTNMGLLVLDAKSCYDRISPPIASIAFKRQGASESFIELMFNTISQMNHYIRTSFGDSTAFYNKGSSQFHGILQGNGAGPLSCRLFSRLSHIFICAVRDLLQHGTDVERIL